MFVRKVLSKDESLLEIQGALSGETAAEFQQHMQELVAEGRARITLNLLGVTTINSSSLGKIVLFKKKLAEEGRILQIRGCTEALYKTFQMVKFDKLIPIEKAFTP
jgi:anti-sigma B factor antagonist